MKNNFMQAGESYGAWRKRHGEEMEAWTQDAPSPCDERCKFWHFMGGMGVGLLLVGMFLV